MPFADLAADITLLPNATPRDRAAPGPLARHPTGPGWFESSLELAAGLEVREGWPGDEPLLADYLRSAAPIASPSSTTASA